jgi:hypothetical protein
MRRHIPRLLPFILVACAMGISALVHLPAPAQPQAAAAPIDFDTLHRQAHDALEQLRQSGERRLAFSATPAM